MKTKHIVSTLLSVLLLAMLAACQGDSAEQKNILVLLSGDKENAGYTSFADELKRTISDGGYKGDYRICWLNMFDAPEHAQAVLKSTADSLKTEGWTPDIIITEGDEAAYLLADDNDKTFNTKQIPVVMSSVQFPEGLEAKGNKNYAIWYDPTDYIENINIANLLSTKNHIQIQLGNSTRDSLIKAELKEAIKRPPFVDNTDLHIRTMSEKLLHGTYRDSIVVTMVNMAEISENLEDPDSIVNDKRTIMRDFLSVSTYYPSLVVSKEANSDIMVNYTDKPQFTAVKEYFADGRGDYLAGYFSGYIQIAHDCGESAMKIFGGKDPASLSGHKHKKQNWMDYDAMEHLGLNYNDYCASFHIVNAPLRIGHPGRYNAIICGIVLVVLLVIFIFYKWIISWRNSIQEQKRKHMEDSRYISRLCLNSTENMPVESVNDLMKYMSFAHPNSADIVDEIRDTIDKPGTYSFRLLCAPKGDGQYELWEFRFKITEPNKVIGIIINKREAMIREERARKIIKQSDETRKREAFLGNLSKEIGKPLKIIEDSCRKFTEDGLTDNEKALLTDSINKNNALLSKEINDVLLFSRIESGRQRYYKTEEEVEALVGETYNEFLSEIPSNINFHIERGRPRIYVVTDKPCLKEVLSEYMQNAIKYTESGEIKVGWRYHLNTHECELYVEDTGIGISMEKQNMLFDMFWKEDEVTEGVGLGLNICKSIAEAMGGHISVSSIKGKGSRFSIWLNATAKSVKQNAQAKQSNYA